MTTGIVSEICLGILESSENDFLTYPIAVAVHVMERTVHGEINYSGCTVNTGSGSWVMAKKSKFSFISEPLPYKYQELKLDEIKKMIENVYIYSSNKLIKSAKLGILNE